MRLRRLWSRILDLGVRRDLLVGDPQRERSARMKESEAALQRAIAEGDLERGRHQSFVARQELAESLEKEAAELRLAELRLQEEWDLINAADKDKGDSGE